MKCQKCNFFSSNRWDLCPKCSYDLRPHKQALGLPITNKTASVAELKILESNSTAGTSKQLVRNTASSQNVTPPLENRNKGEQTQQAQSSGHTPWLKRVFGHGPTQKENRSQENLLPQIPVQESLNPKRVEDLPLKDSNVTLEKQPLLQRERLAGLSQSQELLPPKSTVTPVQKTSVPEAKADQNLTPNWEQSPQQKPLQQEDPFQISWENDNDALFPKRNFTSSSDLPPSRAEPAAAPQVVEFGDDDQLLEEQLDKLLGDDVLNVTSVKEKPTSSSRSTPSEDDRSLSEHEEEVDFEFEIESSKENEDDDQVTFPFPSQEDLPLQVKGFVSPNDQQAARPSLTKRFAEENDKILGGLIAAFGTLDAGVAHVDISPSPQKMLMKSGDLPEQSTPFPAQAMQHIESQALQGEDSQTLQRLLSTVHAQDQLLHELIVLVSEVYGIDQKVLTEEETLRALEEELDVELEQLLSEGTTFVEENLREELPSLETLQKEISKEQPFASPEVEDGMDFDALAELLQEYNQLATSHLQSLGEDVRERVKPPDASVYEPPGDMLERQWHSLEEDKKKDLK